MGEIVLAAIRHPEDEAPFVDWIATFKDAEAAWENHLNEWHDHTYRGCSRREFKDWRQACVSKEKLAEIVARPELVVTQKAVVRYADPALEAASRAPGKRFVVLRLKDSGESSLSLKVCRTAEEAVVVAHDFFLSLGYEILGGKAYDPRAAAYYGDTEGFKVFESAEIDGGRVTRFEHWEGPSCYVKEEDP